MSVVLFMVTAFTAANYSFNGLFLYFLYLTEQIQLLLLILKPFEENN